jgi:hypothetical protein
MQFDRRFADYGLTGGFFLICQLVVLWTFGYGSPIINGIKALPLNTITDGSFVGPIITGFAGALGIIAVFVVGLLLDLLASVLRPTEMNEFVRHLRHNAHWLRKLVEAHKEYCGTDYERIESSISGLSPTKEFLTPFVDTWHTLVRFGNAEKSPQSQRKR